MHAAGARNRGIVFGVNAGMFSGTRLKTRLIFWTATIVVLAVGGSFEIRTRVTASMLERDVEERSLTLVRVASRVLQDEIDDDMEARLQDFVDADPAMSRIDLFRTTAEGLTLVASTSEFELAIPDTLPAASDSRIETRGGIRELVTIDSVVGTDFWIVARSSLEGLDRYIAVNRIWAAVFSGGVIVIVVLLMNFMFDRLVSRRFDRLLGNLRHAEESGFNAREEPNDEIGVLAGMFADLLARFHVLNEDLKSQVDEATGSLHRRNQRLEETTHRLIAMQKKLLQSERLATVGQMAATFAHEIGSPLSSLSAHIQLLLEEPELSVEQRESLETIRREVRSLVEIVSELLRSARHGPEDFVPVNMNDVIESVHRLVEPRLSSQSIEVRSRLEPVPMIRGYRLYLEEVVLNLINNASEAMPDGGRLELSAWHDNKSQQVFVRIADNGPGIDPAVAGRALETFVTTRELGSGTGLGLAIVHDIVVTHGGSVELGSNDGRGTSVLLSFPALSGETANAYAPAPGR